MGAGAGPLQAFGEVSAIRTGKGGKIFVSDPVAMAVKVYDREGQALGQIGGWNLSPNHLRSIRGFYVDSSGTVTLVDTLSDAILIFEEHGRLLNVSRSEHLDWINGTLRQVPEAGFVTALYDRHDRWLFHHYGNGLKGRPQSFGRASYFLEGTDSIIGQEYAELYPGRLWADRKGGFVFAPGLYSGNIFLFERDGDAFARARSLRGFSERSRPFDTVPVDPGGKRSYNFLAAINGTPHAARIHSESRGVFVLNDGRIVHFVSTRPPGQDEKKTLVVELYSSRGVLSGYGCLLFSHKGGPCVASNPTFDVLWKDDNDRFFALDQAGSPIVRIGSLELEVSEDRLTGVPMARREK